VNNKRFIIIFFCWLCHSHSFSQEINIYGRISDSSNHGIESASVAIYNQQNKNLGYSFTDQNGNYNISLIPKLQDSSRIEISCLGYQKLVHWIDLRIQNHDFMLRQKIDTLKEVVIKSGKKIDRNRDTTFIKVDNFSNKTEQTIEDILKKLPGIVVKKDGTIIAHGKAIDKLLIEGEDIFANNYRILTKNLEAKTLDEVQILDNFEDNPVYKKLNNSDKVALNLKLKKGYNNILFGNVTAGGSIASGNRWKENLTIGLLKKKIKGFYFGDYNNLGEKSTDLISTNVINKNIFSNDRIEYTAKPFYTIANNNVSFFNNTQSVFNKALLNSLSFSSKLKKNTSIRGVIYDASDNQFQNFAATTKYNLQNNPVSFQENSNYKNKKLLTSAELELKHYANKKNYFTNLLIIKNSPNKTFNSLLLNNSQIVQNLNSKNFTFYNHFNYTIQISENKVLNNYVYAGNDKILESSTIKSPSLNNFLAIDTTKIVNENANNKLFFAGIKSKLISKFKKVDLTNSIQFEYRNERFSNTFLANNLDISMYENNTRLKLFNIYQENTLRYNFTRQVDFTTSINFQNTSFNSNKINKNIFFINPTVSFNVKKTPIGNFSLSYFENNTIPEINQLTTNFYLSDFRSFLFGTNYAGILKNSTISFNYYFYNDEKRYSFSVSSYYTDSRSIINTSSNITDDFTFNSYVKTRGGTSYNTSISLVKYIRKLNLASKIENVSYWQSMPLSVNTTTFLNSKGFTNALKCSGTTYFKMPINFDFSFSYNYFQSVFPNIKIHNATYEDFLNVNYKATNTFIIESNNSVYFINKQQYYFCNIILNYNPAKSRFSFRTVFNNLANQNQFTNILINNFTYYKSTIQLMPRYILLTIKYRF